MEDEWMCCWLMQFSWKVGGEEIIFDFVGFSGKFFTAVDFDISLGTSSSSPPFSTKATIPKQSSSRGLSIVFAIYALRI
jgi:hypothetical protein